MNIEVLWDGTYGLSPLSEKTRKSNRLQMSLQRQHFLLSYLKTLSVGPAGVRTYDLPHSSPVLNQLSQPGDLANNLNIKKTPLKKCLHKCYAELYVNWVS